MLASQIRKMMAANQQELDEQPVNKRREMGAKHGWKGYTRSTTRHTQSYSKVREELQQRGDSR
jgi:hypothetical protein